MFGTKERFDLCSLPFSGRDSRLAIFEDEETRELYLTFSRSPTPRVERKRLIRFAPLLIIKILCHGITMSNLGSSQLVLSREL